MDVLPSFSSSDEFPDSVGSAMKILLWVSSSSFGWVGWCKSRKSSGPESLFRDSAEGLRRILGGEVRTFGDLVWLSGRGKSSRWGREKGARCVFRFGVFEASQAS